MYVHFYYLCRGRGGNHEINSLSTVLEYDTTYISQSEGCITRGTSEVKMLQDKLQQSEILYCVLYCIVLFSIISCKACVWKWRCCRISFSSRRYCIVYCIVLYCIVFHYQLQGLRLEVKMLQDKLQQSEILYCVLYCIVLFSIISCKACVWR